MQSWGGAYIYIWETAQSQEGEAEDSSVAGSGRSWDSNQAVCVRNVTHGHTLPNWDKWMCGSP